MCVRVRVGMCFDVEGGMFVSLYLTLTLAHSLALSHHLIHPLLNGKCELKLLKHNVHRQISNLLEIRLRLIFFSSLLLLILSGRLWCLCVCVTSALR